MGVTFTTLVKRVWHACVLDARAPVCVCVQAASKHNCTALPGNVHQYDTAEHGMQRPPKAAHQKHVLDE